LACLLAMVDPVSSSKEDDSKNMEDLSQDEQGNKSSGGDQKLPSHDGILLETQIPDSHGSKKLEARGTHIYAETEAGHTEISAVGSNAITGKSSSFAQLVRTWETYMTDGTGGQFQPLQVFQQMSMCGPEDGLARFADPYGSYTQNYADLHEPSVFGRTHSTPSQHTHSILDDEDEDEPPPYGLEILNRSRSTPLSTSANSAFGTILKKAPYRHNAGDRSAFTLPLHRSTSAGSQTVSRQTTFNPIKHDKDLETEMTSIEVMDLPSQPLIDDKPKPKSTVQTAPSASENNASGRAARFLSDVSRNFRRRYIQRGGRDNPARPPSSSDDSAKKGDEETISSKSTTSSSSKSTRYEPEPRARTAASKSRHGIENVSRGQENPAEALKTATGKVHDTPYQQLDSDHDEDGKPFATDYVGVDSPATVSSPVYHQMDEDNQLSSQLNRVSIQVSSSTRERSLLVEELYTAASPEPAQIAADCSTLASQSNDSPGTSRCSATTYTSGHTTHATSTTYSSEQLSHLSSISETDREVMEANKAGNLLNQGQGISRAIKSDALTESIPLASSRNVRYREYVALADSPVNLREGATVPADRFFTYPDSHSAEKRGLGRIRNSMPSKKSISHSPTTTSSASMTTNSSASSAADAPPTFVSYLDGKLTSDLSFMRESGESSSPRGEDSNSEKRESSPAEMLGYSDVVFEEAKAPRNADTGTTSKKPLPIWPTKGLHFGRRVRSLPPRSPHKGARTPTTPPPGTVSPAYNCLSPPRNIVDHRIDPNVSKPSIVIRAPVSSRLVVVQNQYPGSYPASAQVAFNRISDGTTSQGGHEVVRIGTGYDMPRSYHSRLPRGPSPLGIRSRTYDEHSIEILKSDSKDDSSPTLLVDSN
jgi:hypothetical protein